MTAFIFFVPAVFSPVFFVIYWVEGGPAYALTYGLLMLLVVWAGLPLFFRLIMKMNYFLYNEKDKPSKKP